MLRTVVEQNLIREPHGPALNVVEAAALLDVSPSRIAELVTARALTGTYDNGKIVGVTRESARTMLKTGVPSRA